MNFKPPYFMKLTYILIIILLFPAYLSSQTMTLTDAEGVNCSQVSIDLNASGFPSNVAAISLKIQYNSQVLDYDSYVSGNLTTNFLFVNQTSGQLNIEWSDPAGQSIEGTCLTLIFNYYGGSTALDFNEAVCEITDKNLNIISTTYVNGSVSNYTNDTLYVDGSVAVSGDGQGWSTAYKTIGEATAQDLKGGDLVLVKPGTYAESIQVTWQGAVDVSPVTGVVISDTNKISFPPGTDLSCIDTAMYPGKYYAMVFRSGNMNNGYYPVTEVDDVNDFVRVSGSGFFPETGTAGDSSKVMAAVFQPVVMRNSSATPETQRVVLNAGTLGTVDAVIEIGGSSSAEVARAVLVDGIDITGASSGTGLRIRNSGLIAFMNGKIYSSNGPGVHLTGTATLPCRFNLLKNNIIYNTPDQAVLVGTTGSTTQNHAHFTHIINNEIYSLGTGTLAGFNNAILIRNGNTHGVIERNLVRDLRMKTLNVGMVSIGSHADSLLVYRNILRNLVSVNAGEHYFIHAGDTVRGLRLFNNLVYNEASNLDQTYAFRINGSLHSGSGAYFNTVYQVHKGLILEDYGTALDFEIKNNILDLNSNTYFTNLGTAGRYTVDHNIFPTLSSSYATGNIIGDPLFISPSSTTINGLRPRYDSPCLGAGISVTGIDLDYLGVERGTPPSIGAFETALVSAVWTGSNGTEWDDSRNWDVGIIPNAYLNAIISPSLNLPTVTSGSAVCRSLDVEPGMQVTVSEGSVLTVEE